MEDWPEQPGRPDASQEPPEVPVPPNGEWVRVGERAPATPAERRGWRFGAGGGRPDGRPPRPRPLVILVLAAVLLVVVLAAVALLVHRGAPSFSGRVDPPLGDRRQRVTAWITSTTRSLDSVFATHALDEIDCDWYTIDATGTVSAGPENLALVAEARRHGVQAFATVTNRPSSRGAFTASIARSILASPAAQQHAIDALVSLAVTKGFDGVDLDWEIIPVGDRDAFSHFVAGLAAALHARHRLLSAAVFAKTSEPGRWDSQKVYDYRALGAAVDELKIMTYSYSGPWSSPGPQAPLAWTKAVIDFARTQVPPSKIYMGLPFFGYDWHKGGVTALQASEAEALVTQHHFKVAHDPASGEANLSYVDKDGVTHVLWYIDRQAVATKIGLLESSFPDIGGIAIWQIYKEDPGFWPLIEQAMRR
jgi:spore germination protein YaaH